MWDIIPSVRDVRRLNDALESDAREVLLIDTHIGNLEQLARRVHDARKRVMVHSDFIGGFKADSDGIRLLRNKFCIDALLSSSLATLGAAKRIPVERYLRVFLVDSRSLDRAIDSLDGFSGDGIELLPAPVAVRVIERFRSVIPDKRILAGGFVSQRSLVQEIRAAGFDGVTTSDISMWSD